MPAMTVNRLVVSLCSALVLVSCLPANRAENVDAQMTVAVETAVAAIVQTQVASTPQASATPVVIPTVPRTPPALPAVFAGGALGANATPHTYIQDDCQYLHDRWAAGNAPPGTIALVIMFHSIEKGESSASDPKNIGGGDFRRMMNGLHDMGFQAINATQLADFLDRNAVIPQRSVVLIQDDRHAAANYIDWFKPYWDQWQWPVINAWINALGGSDPVLAENVALEKEGWVDHQAHGVVHNIPMSDSSTDEYLTGELQGAITNMQQYFGKTPIAIIWPGGGFGTRPVQFARKFGYRLGFTVNPRGPIMYNWVPLADQPDPQNAISIPEGSVNDPRMVLPRYWPSQVLQNLDSIRLTGEQAAAYAEQNKTTELDYYDIVCAPSLGSLP
ncbi:MAG TPA: hypothetical protein VFH29_04115 [Anaerolineales bacterium]|nr:hypothetical protein [Anaerolineales bacterium]